MNITIDFEQADLIKYIRDVLAVNGFEPKGDIILQQNDAGELRIQVACVPCAPLETCPVCHAPMQSSVLTHVTDEEYFDDTDAAKAADTGEDANEPPPPRLSAALGESLEYPGTSEDDAASGTASTESDTGDVSSIKSLLAASKRLALTKKPLRSLHTMSGESDRPPKPGEGI